MGGLAVVDSVVGVLSIAWTFVSEGIRSIDTADVVTLVVALAVGIAARIIRDRVRKWRTQYINRFVRRGLKRIAANYAFWLAGVLFASGLALIELRHLLPTFAQGAILGSAITAMVALSHM